MTEVEMLRLCLEAFEAIPTSTTSRKLLKKIKKVPKSYAGNGSHILAKEMTTLLRAHLEIEEK